jgi:queuine tRNA-ribosyltransferase
LFKLLKKDSNTNARCGLINLAHGEIETPVFMPVGTNGIVKTFLPQELYEMNINIILANSYHLYLRPGLEVLESQGGLHNFSRWNKNILTDSGGFQIFSLNKLNKITEKGITFQSHIDGSRHFLAPEDVVNVQRIIGSDIMMVLDHCTPPATNYADALKALTTTTNWATRSREQYKKIIDPDKQKMFGIIQGNFFKDLRKKSAEEIIAVDFDGYAIGGLSVGESKEVFIDILQYTAELLPQDKARYLMGVGTPLDMFIGVENGIDMFDCVFPTRIARNAAVFTEDGRINLRNEKYKFDGSPLDQNCSCSICKNFSRSYIRHLFRCKEISAARMASYHNIYFMKQLMQKIRQSIINGNFSEYKKEYFEKYKNF